MSLEPIRVVRSPVQLPPTGPRGGSPAGPAVPAASAAAATAAAAVWMHRRRTRDNEPMFVVVHGHGGTPDDFDVLLAKMGVDPDRVVAFDYSTVDGGQDSRASSRTVPTTDAARSLDQLIRQLSISHSNIYSIHHSKGAATGAVMISALDDGEKPLIDGYRGAALLDPPIARGALGALQRLGQGIPWVPDNGGFDAIDCGLFGCHDLRDELGEASGVETIVIKNPDAALTNFGDAPEGLRVYNLINDGGSSAWKKWWNPLAFVERAFEAHASVLTHDAVAACIAQEVESPRSCDWNGGRHRPNMWGTSNTFNLVK